MNKIAPFKKNGFKLKKKNNEYRGQIEYKKHLL